MPSDRKRTRRVVHPEQKNETSGDGADARAGRESALARASAPAVDGRQLWEIDVTLTYTGTMLVRAKDKNDAYAQAAALTNRAHLRHLKENASEVSHQNARRYQGDRKLAVKKGKPQ